MSSIIDIYDSYTVGTKTYTGSFPFYNNVAAIACSVSAANVIQNNFAITYDLNENYLFDYFIMEPGDANVDPYTQIPLVVDYISEVETISYYLLI